MLVLEKIKRTDPRILANMAVHYSQPKGFVGRNICYAILYKNVYYGSIAGGSCALHLPNRNNYFGIDKTKLNCLVNNIFFHIEKNDNKYPLRNFAEKIVKLWRETIIVDWENKYGDRVIGFETLVEPPRTGEIYIRDNWELIGKTKGYQLRRISGKTGNSKWGGKRVFDKINLRPKLVFVRKNEKYCNISYENKE